MKLLRVVSKWKVTHLIRKTGPPTLLWCKAWIGYPSTKCLCRQVLYVILETPPSWMGVIQTFVSKSWANYLFSFEVSKLFKDVLKTKQCTKYSNYLETSLYIIYYFIHHSFALSFPTINSLSNSKRKLN